MPPPPRLAWPNPRWTKKRVLPLLHLHRYQKHGATGLGHQRPVFTQLHLHQLYQKISMVFTMHRCTNATPTISSRAHRSGWNTIFTTNIHCGIQTLYIGGLLTLSLACIVNTKNYKKVVDIPMPRTKETTTEACGPIARWPAWEISATKWTLKESPG